MFPFTRASKDYQPSKFICSVCQFYISIIFWQLLVKNAEERLGMPNSVHGKITEHTFFAGVDWLEAEHGRLCPPFVPMTVGNPRIYTQSDHLPALLPLTTIHILFLQNSPRDTSHFEEAFTAEKRNFFNVGGSTPSDNFADFEYTNPNMTDWKQLLE